MTATPRLPEETVGRRKRVPAGRATLRGLLYGLSAVAMWAAYLAYTRQAMVEGLAPQDIALIRFGISAIIVLPWVMMRGIGDLAGVGWVRGAVLATTIGPLFILLAAGGFAFAPLAHGAVLQPSTAALASIAGSIWFLGERVTAARLVGAAAIIGGITLIATTQSVQSAGAAAGDLQWVGDILFVMAGLGWASFTILLIRWKLDAVAATAAVCLCSGIVTVPLFFALDDLSRIMALSDATFWIQIVIQGVTSAILAIVAFGRAAALLGASGAALFPAIVPAAALIAGIPITGEIPTLFGWAGAMLATLGLAIAMGAFERRSGHDA